LLLESLLALRRENKEVLWSSMVKDTMKRKKPSFNEAYHGYRTFSDLLLDAQKEGLVELETDKRSRTYVVTRFASEQSDPDPESQPARKRKRRRTRRRPGDAPTSPASAAREKHAELADGAPDASFEPADRRAPSEPLAHTLPDERAPQPVADEDISF
jgi:hypothetical protein